MENVAKDEEEMRGTNRITTGVRRRITAHRGCTIPRRAGNQRRATRRHITPSAVADEAFF